MIEIGAAVKAAEELDKAIGIFAKVAGKLKANPNLAAQKLAQALAEVAKTLQAVDNSASEFLSLGIDEGALAKNSKLLLDIEGGKLTTEVERGRGHCHVISAIYWKYLDKWFERTFQKDDYASVKNVFLRLGDADSDLFHYLAEVASKLEKEAGDVLKFVLNNEAANARNRVLLALPALSPLRKTMSNTMQKLYSIQGQFVDMTTAV
jgi:hypothetical protein